MSCNTYYKKCFVCGSKNLKGKHGRCICGQDY